MTWIDICFFAVAAALVYLVGYMAGEHADCPDCRAREAIRR